MVIKRSGVYVPSRYRLEQFVMLSATAGASMFFSYHFLLIALHFSVMVSSGSGMRFLSVSVLSHDAARQAFLLA